jgi:tetratricopeptide (TPR) repeat protein
MILRCGKAVSVVLFAGLAAAAGVVLAPWIYRHWGRPASVKRTFPPPPYSTSRYLNTGPDARYVGISVCADCHPKKHQSYLLTPHSQALSDLDPKLEPPDGTFFHEASGRSYRIYRRDGEFRQEEVLRTAEGQEIARVDLPIRFLVGSGHFARSYLVEIDGFLHESPITWYPSKKKWGVSPGYDAPSHWGFERPVDAGCLVCHAGRVEPAAGTVHRLIFHEKAIGCESCHGPGSLHAELHREKKYVSGTEDLTIVNPGKLSRAYLEAVCAFCHLSGPASVWLRGRDVTDYRPSMPLTDYRIDYRFESGNEQMTVVGHVEQLRQSACYQKSKDLTCLSCHDPHAKEKPKDTIAFYRQKCLDCHAEQGCKLQRVERLMKEPADDCSACHMPRGDTDIPHVAFTHHRIGLHGKRPPRAAPARIPELVPTDDISRLSPIDQKRNLGLAYLLVFQNPEYARHADVARERARELLEEVRAEGMRDDEASGGLAEIWFKKGDFKRAAEHARETLEAGTSVEARARALLILASCEMQQRNFEPARVALEELVRLRRNAEDWRLLGLCYLELDRGSLALPALEKAQSIRPYRPTVHLGLELAYRQKGDFARAAEHQAKARWLFEHGQD